MNSYFYVLKGDDIIYKIGDNLVYKKDVCEVIEIKEHDFKDLTYYVLRPIFDKSLKIQVPIDNNFIRDIISKKELNRIIDEIPNVDLIDIEDKQLENEYKKLINSDDYLDLVKIIKTTYIRNKQREENKKKISDKDKHYFDLAEKYLYGEFSVVLNKTIDETKDYIINKVEKVK